MTLTLPSLEKSWIFGSSMGVSNFLNQVSTTVGYLHSSNLPPTNAAGDLQVAMSKLVTSLTSFYSNPWVLVNNSFYTGSGSTFVTSTSFNGWTNTDGYVAAPFQLQWGVSNHSWIVLKQTQMQGGGPAMICIDLNNSSSNGYFAMIFSPGGLFTGGSTSARPTATDEIVLGNSLSLMSNSNYLGSVVHVMQSADGYCTRAFVCQAGLLTFAMQFESIVPDVSSNLSMKMAAYANGAGTGFTLGSSFVSTANYGFRYGSSNYTAYGTCEYGGSATIPAANGGAISDFTGGYPMAPVGLVCTTIGARGKVGRFVDLWLGSTAVPSFATYPISGGKNFIQIGALIFPWDGATVPIINA